MKPKIIAFDTYYFKASKIEKEANCNYLFQLMMFIGGAKNAADLSAKYESEIKQTIMIDFYKGYNEVKDFVKNLNKEDIVIFQSLADIHPKPAKGIDLLELLYKKGITTYLVSVSRNQTYAEYRTELLKVYEHANCIKLHTRTPKYPKELMDYLVSLRMGEEQVRYEDIEEISGIKRSTLIMHMKYTIGKTPGVKKKRNITKKEIEKIREILVKHNLIKDIQKI